MRVAVNLLFLGPGLPGDRVYCVKLLRSLAAVEAANEYFLIVRQGVELPGLPAERFHLIRAPVSEHSRVWRTVWEYGLMPRRVRGARPAVLHGLGSRSPAVAPCPLILTVHDVIYRRFPESAPLSHRLFMRCLHGREARRADRVLVPSHHAAREVAECLGVRDDRIRVVPLGPGNDFQPLRDEGVLREVRARYRLRCPYVLSVCRAYPHKNLPGLLRAFRRLRDMGQKEVQLVLAGDRSGWGRGLDRLTGELGLADAVVFTGYVSDRDVNALYTAAAVFAFPSLAEGFGLPVLEAMACGTPVVASRFTAGPEVAGPAGLIADPSDPEEFARALARVLGDARLREDLRAKGLARARGFTWERCARETLAVY
jgi:glycosyltransferase involved in cell wall biosynthesis